ncbi:MAG: 4Fe-4S dicluster domain-containing protein [Dehalococcoidia bacterium]|nr:4Fe-4S dicluster domain-containing protein [Dehalococcoidia bacterium]MDD5493457.1 4Fe-4S dicluster domain-containing protein [Dehalococcoidia bacterium]
MKINGTRKSNLKQTVEELSGVRIDSCLKCMKCTSGCSVAKETKMHPSELIGLLKLGAGDEILKSDLVWMCLSCEICYGRCPMKINTASLIDALRKLAVERGTTTRKGNAPLFNKAFLGTVKQYGRSYDLQMIMHYKFGSGSLMQDTEKFPTMLRKGKMALLPPYGAKKTVVKRIFDTSPGGKGKIK